MDDRPAYGWSDANPTHAHDYLWPKLRAILDGTSSGERLRVVDLGCGNGALTARLSDLGHDVTGIDASKDGIAIARKTHPDIEFVLRPLSKSIPQAERGSADMVTAVEVVEHLYRPHELFLRARELLRPGGTVVVTTPYHGYLKNLAISLIGGWDRHMEPLRTGGHIKFFSRSTLGALAKKHGFTDLRFDGAGRVPLLWKSLIMVARWSGEDFATEPGGGRG